jgi:purine nucleoside permease
MRHGFLTCVTGALLALAAARPAVTPALADDFEPLPIRVVIVNAFQIGTDTGGSPGEAAAWVEQLPLPTTIPFAGGDRALRYNADLQVLEIVTGEGPTRMASALTALGYDPRFDLTHAYWLLAGIGGIDPNAGSAGSAGWAEYVVDGDLAYEIDAREIPPDWSTGYVPLGRATPYQTPVPPASSLNGTNLFHLNHGLVNWAYRFSSTHASLPDDANLQTLRALYTGYPKAQLPPAIIKGDVMGSGKFWLGALLNQWAENWMTYWSHGHGHFALTSEEDAGFLQALTYMAQANRVDINRVMVLRSASNYSVPPPGETAAQLLAGEANGTGYSAFIESLAAAYTAGSPVVLELARHWNKYRDQIPE